MEDVSHQRNRRRCVGADAPTCSDFFSPRLARVPQHPRQRRRTDDLARVGQRGRGGASLVARPQDAAGARPGRTEQAGGTEPAPRGSEGRSPLTKRGLVFGKASGSASHRHFLRPEAPSAHLGVAPAALVSLSLSLPRANRGWRRPHSPCQGETVAATGERHESTNLHGHAPDARPCWRREAGSAD